MSFLEIFCLTLLVEDLVIAFAGHEFESFDSIWVDSLLRDYLVGCWNEANDANEMIGSDDGTAEANGVLGRTRAVFIGRSGIRLHWGHAHPSACRLQPFYLSFAIVIEISSCSRPEAIIYPSHH